MRIASGLENLARSTYLKLVRHAILSVLGNCLFILVHVLE